MGNVLSRRLELFHSLSADDKDLLDEITRRSRDVSARSEIVRQGDAPRDALLILDGYACRFKLLRHGTRQIFSCMIPGDLSDLDAHLLPVADHTIATLSACTVVDISRERLSVLLGSPRIGRALRCAALVEVAITREWLINLGQRSADSRIGHFFCELLLRLEAVGFAVDDRIPFPLTQADLGDAMGLSTVHVNRVLQSLRARGLISLKHGHLSITDHRGLWALSDFNPDYLHFGTVGRTELKYA